MLQIILGYFGYCKIPKEAIQLSMMQEKFLHLLIKHESEEEGRNFFKRMLEGQKSITKFLRSGKILQ